MEVCKVLLCLAGFIGIAACCNERLIDQCLSGFAADVGVSRAQLEAGYQPDFTKDTLNRACKAYDNFEDCVKKDRSYCPTMTRVVLEGIENMYDYICGDGFDKHLEHEECLKSKGVENNVLRCADQAQQQFDGIFLDKNDVCDIFKDSLDCVKDAVKDVCGSEAADHQVELEKEFLKPLAGEIDCNLDGMNMGVIIGVIVAVVVIVIICVVVCLCCARQKNKRRFDEENNQQQMNVVTQPGATAPSYPGSVVDPPAYNVYEDPNTMHPSKPPAYDNQTYAYPDANGTSEHAYTGLPGKE